MGRLQIRWADPDRQSWSALWVLAPMAAGVVVCIWLLGAVLALPVAFAALIGAAIGLAFAVAVTRRRNPSAFPFRRRS
jgi:hypothetical protein